MQFVQLPLALFDRKYESLNNDARVIYALLHDRMSLSVKNGFQDARGYFCLFTQTKLAQMLGRSLPTIRKALKLLEAVGLLLRKRMGLTKPDRLYVFETDGLPTGRKKDQPSRPNQPFLSEEKQASTNQTEGTKRILTYTDRNQFRPSATDLVEEEEILEGLLWLEETGLLAQA